MIFWCIPLSLHVRILKHQKWPLSTCGFCQCKKVNKIKCKIISSVWWLRHPIRKSHIPPILKIRMTNKSVDILSNKLIDFFKNIGILTVTSPIVSIVIRCQSEVYWLWKQRIFFVLWLTKFKFNIKRLVCKQWVLLYSAKCLWSIGEVSVYHQLYRPL